MLASPRVMAHPRSQGRFILDCDASDHATIYAVLSQIQDAIEKVMVVGVCLEPNVTTAIASSEVLLLSTIAVISWVRNSLSGPITKL